MISRQQANRAILNVLSQYIEDNPNIRFHQMLHNLNLEENAYTPGGQTYCEDFFYLESDKALERISTMLDEPINIGTIDSDFMEENEKPIFRKIICFDERMEDDPEEMEYLKEDFGIETYEGWLTHFDIIENEIMIMKSADWGMKGYGDELQYHFSCGPSIGDGCVSCSIYIDGYIEQVAERGGFANKVETQLSENFHGINVDNSVQAESVYLALIDGFTKDGFKVIEVHPK